MPTKKKRKVVIPDNLDPVVDEQEFVPSVFTGNKLAQDDPERYGKIVQGLGEGKALTRLAKKYKVAPETIMAIAKREQKTIDSVQSLTRGLTADATQATLMKIIEKLESYEIPPGVLPIAFGILRDKEKNDRGQATSMIEHKKVVTIDEVNRELETMRTEAIEANVT